MSVHITLDGLEDDRLFLPHIWEDTVHTLDLLLMIMTFMSAVPEISSIKFLHGIQHICMFLRLTSLLQDPVLRWNMYTAEECWYIRWGLMLNSGSYILSLSNQEQPLKCKDHPISVYLLDVLSQQLNNVIPCLT